MTAISSANTNCSKEEPMVLAATEALRTGLFQPVPCVDPDLSPRLKTTEVTPGFWDRLLRR